jgi:PEP-CTERM motif
MNLVFSTRLPRIGLAALALVGAVIAAPRFANASAATMTFDVPTVNITQEPYDQTGYFDVTISDTTSDKLGQFLVGVTTSPGASSIAIVGADLGQLTNGEYADPSSNSFMATNPDGIGQPAGASPNLIDPYVFAQDGIYADNNSGGLQNGFLQSFDSTDAGNSDLTNSGTVTLAANTLYSLVQVYYDIPANTPVGSYAIALNSGPVVANAPAGNDYVNLVSNSNGTSYAAPGTQTSGAFVVTAAVIPEPASVVLMLFGAVGLIGIGMRRARRA